MYFFYFYIKMGSLDYITLRTPVIFGIDLEISYAWALGLISFDKRISLDRQVYY